MRTLGTSGTSDGLRPDLAQSRSCRGLKGMTCPWEAWLGDPQSCPERLPDGEGGPRAHSPIATWFRAGASTFLDLPGLTRGSDFGWDPVPTQSLGTFQGLPGRQSQEPVAGWEGLRQVVSPAPCSGNLGAEGPACKSSPIVAPSEVTAAHGNVRGAVFYNYTSSRLFLFKSTPAHIIVGKKLKGWYSFCPGTSYRQASVPLFK